MSSALRTTRALRGASRQFARQQPLRAVRFQTTNSTAATVQTHSNRPLIAGILGGTITFMGGYAWYHFSGAKTIVNAASTTQKYFESAKAKLKESAPDSPNEGLKWLQSTATQYAAFIPGGAAFVNAAFKDLDIVRNKHGDDVDRIVKEAYTELKQLTDKKGLSIETAWDAWGILQKHLEKIGELAGDSASDILDNHPQIKKQIGGNLKQLKSMGDKYGPEAKKQVDDLWNQIADIVKTSGMNIESATSKLQKLVQEKTEQIKKLGDEAWKKGLEEAKPYLDKNPEIKQLVEENADALKQGNASELFQKVVDAVKSGDTEKLKGYVNDAVDQAGNSNFGSGVNKYITQIPGASQIIPKLKQFRDIAKEHGDEAEKLMQETVKEIQQVLEKKLGQAQDLANKAKKE